MINYWNLIIFGGALIIFGAMNQTYIGASANSSSSRESASNWPTTSSQTHMTLHSGMSSSRATGGATYEGTQAYPSRHVLQPGMPCAAIRRVNDLPGRRSVFRLPPAARRIAHSFQDDCRGKWL